MSKIDEIREGLKKKAKEHGPAPTILEKVVSVDAANFTCVLENEDGNKIENVRLRPVLDGKESITILPKVGTWCLAVRIEDVEQWMAVSFGEIDKANIKIGNCIYEQTANGFVIKKGEDVLWDAMKMLFESLEQIMVLQGNNPDFIKMALAKTKIKNILNGT